MTTPSRIPPQNLEAEAAVLGAIMIENDTIYQLMDTLRPEDFYRQSHGKIFRAMVRLVERSEPIDVITLSESLKVQGDLESIGGATYLTSIHQGAFTAVNAAYYARRVKEAADGRALLAAIQAAAEEIYSSSDELLSIASRLESALSALHDRETRSFRPIDEVLIETQKRIEKAYGCGSLVSGIPTGFTLIDDALGGIHPGELFIIAARPSMGKTALAAGIAEGAAKQTYQVAFISAESSSTEIAQRLLAKVTGIENRDLRRGKLLDSEFQRVVWGQGELSALSIHLLDRERSWDRIKAKIRALKLKQPGLALVILDYVGLISAPTAKGERYLEIGRISAEAKCLAIELGLGFVLLSQVNREAEDRPDKRPKLSDLRESGCLEQDADVVGFLYRDAYYNKNAKPEDLAEFIIAKNRNGTVGKVDFRFDERTVSFRDWTDPPGRGKFESTSRPDYA